MHFVRLQGERAVDAPVCAAESAVSAPDFPHQGSDLHPDPAVTWGTLENGMRYCLIPNQQPVDKVSLRLLVESGP